MFWHSDTTDIESFISNNRILSSRPKWISNSIRACKYSMFTGFFHFQPVKEYQKIANSRWATRWVDSGTDVELTSKPSIHWISKVYVNYFWHFLSGFEMDSNVRDWQNVKREFDLFQDLSKKSHEDNALLQHRLPDSSMQGQQEKGAHLCPYHCWWRTSRNFPQIADRCDGLGF